MKRRLLPMPATNAHGWTHYDVERHTLVRRLTWRDLGMALADCRNGVR